MGLGREVCESPNGGSGELVAGRLESLGGSSGTEGTLGSDGGSAVEPPLFPAEAIELPGRAIDSTGSAEASTGEGVGLSPPGSLVFAGGAPGLGRDAGLAALAEDVVCSSTVVGSAGAATAEVVGGTSHAVGVNAIGGSKRSKVVSPLAPVNIPVHADAHVGSRENISVGGTINGSQGGPIVRITLPSVDVLFPKPQVGQARSLISSGDIPSSSPGPISLSADGSPQRSPIIK